MLTPTDIREHVKRSPFQPFRVCLSDGRTFEVRHPELCMLGRNAILIGIPDLEEDGLFSRYAQCALLHITGIEPLNGRKPRRAARRRKR
jgi:hypothetical protein